MLHRFLLFIVISLFLSACYGNKKLKKPENLISKNEMVNILIDIKIMASATGVNKDLLDKHGIHQEDFIYKKHNIDSLQFALSNEYYSFYMTEYEAIYQKVNDSLTLLQEIYKKQNEREIEEKRIQDSIAKIVIDTTEIEKKLLIKDDLNIDINELEGLIESVSDKDLQRQ
jgi:hypothetical protein